MTTQPSAGWTEDDSVRFVELGSFFVPDRELQMELVARLLPLGASPYHVLDVGCGEGLLAETVLEAHPDSVVHGLDGSEAMLERARDRLYDYDERFEAEPFSLAQADWRTRRHPVHAVVSSLVIHHLDDFGKRTLYRDLHDGLEPGGVIVIADLVRPATLEAKEAAADAWDHAVRHRAEALGRPDAWQRFRELQWNVFRYPDPDDQPSALADQLVWLAEAGFVTPDVYWMRAGHALFGARKP